MKIELSEAPSEGYSAIVMPDSNNKVVPISKIQARHKNGGHNSLINKLTRGNPAARRHCLDATQKICTKKDL